MASPPAWSIGTSKRSTDWRTGGQPGPGAYNPSNLNKNAAPGWRLGTASRSTDRKNDTPGPGSYNSPGKISPAPPSYGIASKYNSADKSFVPGPGAYNATGLRGYDATPPAFSFRVKTANPDGRTKVPGPGAYDQTTLVANQTSPAYRIGTSKRDELYRSGEVPGPGQYSTRPSSAFNKDSGPKYGFGTSDRNELNAMSKTLPGPGTYAVKGTFESPGKGTSLVPRRPDSALLSASRSPGPGAYNPSLNDKPQQPAYRIGSASRDGYSRERVGTPGPGNYNPRLIQSQQNIRIGTSMRSPMSEGAKTPGPGSYALSPKIGEGPKYIINPRRDDVAKTQHARYVPGPGAYTPSVEFAKTKSPAIRMGTSSRDGFYETKTNPGPGQYDVRGRIGGPKWGFGSEQRRGDYKSGTPGPGSYNLKSTVGNVPKYAYGNAPLKIQL